MVRPSTQVSVDPSVLTNGKSLGQTRKDEKSTNDICYFFDRLPHEMRDLIYEHLLPARRLSPLPGPLHRDDWPEYLTSLNATKTFRRRKPLLPADHTGCCIYATPEFEYHGTSNRIGALAANKQMRRELKATMNRIAKTSLTDEGPWELDCVLMDRTPSDFAGEFRIDIDALLQWRYIPSRRSSSPTVVLHLTSFGPPELPFETRGWDRKFRFNPVRTVLLNNLLLRLLDQLHGSRRVSAERVAETIGVMLDSSDGSNTCIFEPEH